MKKIFISYRREDSEHQTGRIYDWLSDHFSRENIFYDVESIDAGLDWREKIESRLNETDVVVAPIGDRWIEELVRREERNDVLVFEISKALKEGVAIIPVLVGKAGMPEEKDLRASILSLHRLNAVSVRPGRDFKTDMNRLIEAIEKSKRARKVPRSTDNPEYLSMAYAQEQLARLAKWGWWGQSDLKPRLQVILDSLVGSSAEQQIKMAKIEWPESGFAKTTDGHRWMLFSQEWESGPGRDVHKRCLAIYIMGDSIEALAIFNYVGDFFGGFDDIRTPPPIVSAGRLAFGEVSEVGP